MGYSSFVVRFWVDESGKVRNGLIEHVGTQENTYFTTFDKMLAFMTDHLSISSSGTGESLDRNRLCREYIDESNLE